MMFGTILAKHYPRAMRQKDDAKDYPAVANHDINLIMQSKSYLGYSPLGFHRVRYVSWGQNGSQPPLICVHGLTRNGRDFDRLAAALQKDRQLFCPDIVGRGESDFLADPLLYTYPQYLNDMVALIALTNAPHIDWVGTSMGGIIGMLLAALPNSPIRKLVINDVGPFSPLSALARIATYTAAVTTFSSVAEVERHMRKIYASFGPLSDADWRHLAQHGTRTLPDGKLTLAHDTAIAKNLQTLSQDVEMWASYDRISCPTLLLHGQQSDILSSEVAEEMTKRGPKARLVTFSDCGHAPALMDRTQINVIAEFLCHE